MAKGPDMGALMKQVQQMQAEMAKAQEELKNETVEASAGGGMVKVTISGDLELRSIEIDPDAVDPEDVEMLQDMVTAAVNEVLRQVQQLQESAMSGAGGGGFDPMAALDALGLGGAGGGGGLGGGMPGGAPNRAARRRKR